MTSDRCLALPPGVLDRPNLSTVAKLVAAALNDRFARFDPCTWVGNRKLADAVGRSVGHVRRGLAELVRNQLLAREASENNPTGRLLWLLWREDGVCGAQPPSAPARTYRSRQFTQGELRDVTKLKPPEAERPQNALRTAGDVGPPIAPAPAGACVLTAVPPIPATIQSLQLGASLEARAELVNRIAHRLHDKNPATYGFLRKWVNAAADGVAGALEALAHGYAKAEQAILCNRTDAGRIMVRRIRDYTYRPPAASRIGAVEAHVAERPLTVAAVAPAAAELVTIEMVDQLERKARTGDRTLRRFHKLALIKHSEGGPEVPPDVQAAAIEALARL